MTLYEITDMALQLINQYSIDGKIIPDDYNAQADYLRRVPNLVNDCLVYLYTNTIPQIAEYNFNKEKGDVLNRVWDEYEMPYNFYQPYGSSVPKLFNRELPVNKYRWVAGRRLSIPPEIEGEITIEYKRYPELFSAEFAPDTTATEGDRAWSFKDGDVECDAPLEMQYAIPYYVAQHLIEQDYLSESYILANEFELKMSRISTVPVLDVRPCEDVYGFDNI